MALCRRYTTNREESQQLSYQTSDNTNVSLNADFNYSVTPQYTTSAIEYKMLNAGATGRLYLPFDWRPA